MRREELLAKGYTEEQTTDLLNTFHEINNENERLRTNQQNLVNENATYKKQLDDINKANMSEQEKTENALKLAEKKLADANKIYNKAKATEILSGLGVSDELIDKLVTDNEETTIFSANLLKNQLENVKASAEMATKEKITNLDPKPTPTNIPQTDDSMTVEKFNKLSMSEQVAWKRANENEYHEMFSN